ncbi:MAG: hypothetical protein GX434_07375 [Peptococcaceae bacterium]|nr:hypothetical protein [Peptococcaceae bacterium]
MGHYCRVCGRTRANESFSGKGHKNHVCKDCSGKAGKKAKRNNLKENVFASKHTVPSNIIRIQSEEWYFDDNWFFEIDMEEQNLDDDE